MVHPVLFHCDDGNDYVVKGRQLGRALIADHVVGVLGALIGAPVASVCLVDVPVILTEEGSMAAHLEPGIGHGSQWISGCRDSRNVESIYEPENEARFAALMLLYGWTVTHDHQFLYRTSPPRLVHSMDHGAFFPDGEDWTIPSLKRCIEDGVVEPDWLIGQNVHCTCARRRAVAMALKTVDDATVAATVGGVPAEWGITRDERAMLCEFLAARRDRLVARVLAECPEIEP